jgi:hypothetical protein
MTDNSRKAYEKPALMARGALSRLTAIPPESGANT